MDELDQLSTRELHDRALHRAERHLDVGFFWELLRLTPVAEAAAGRPGEADTDIQASRALLTDAFDSDEKLREALRPVYIDYLRRHGDDGRPAGARGPAGAPGAQSGGGGDADG